MATSTFFGSGLPVRINAEPSRKVKVNGKRRGMEFCLGCLWGRGEELDLAVVVEIFVAESSH